VTGGARSGLIGRVNGEKALFRATILFFITRRK
jgi:hypothetical protein